jgi:hypothetical protein
MTADICYGVFGRFDLAALVQPHLDFLFVGLCIRSWAKNEAHLYLYAALDKGR